MKISTVPRLACFALLGASLLVSACTAPPSGRTNDGRLKVVAAESPWGSVAQAIGGDRVAVTSLVSLPNTDPHEFTPSAVQAAAVSTAALVIDNGLGYDTFMEQLLAPGAAGSRRVVTAAAVLQVTSTTANPHLWYSIRRVPEVANAIERALEAQDPAGTDVFRQRLADFIDSLEPITTALGDIRRERGGSAVAQTERVAGYLLAEAGLRVSSPEGFARAVEAGREPDALSAASMSRLLSAGHADALVVNIQATSAATTQAIAEARRGSVPIVEVTETNQPVGTSFAAWQRRQVALLSRSMGVGP
ncbi:MAG: zinc ABC transporter substrate-binding protein [Actinomycetes bacterium]